MAFKNLVTPNPASCSRFSHNLEGIELYNDPIVTPNTPNPFTGEESIKITTNGTQLQGVALNTQTLQQSAVYSGTWEVYCETPINAGFYLGGDGGDAFWTYLLPGHHTVLYENHARIDVAGEWVVILTDTASVIYLIRTQIEQNDHATSYEFPGVDLTGQSIPSNTNVNNVKLENIIKAFGIESQEQVNNLTLENILTLTNIPSEEYVNNIELLNEIIMEGIENTTSIHDLIIYILNEIAVYHVNIQRKQEYNTILNTKQTYEVKV